MTLKTGGLALLIVLMGALLRFHALVHDARFHPDEALFSTFARGAAVQGDWLLPGPLDKPPLTIYAVALSMSLVGVRPLDNGVLTLDIHTGEFAARLPGALASIILIPLIGRLAWDLYPDASRENRCSTMLLAMLLMALSPFAVAFSATVFTDGLMLLCIVVALWQAAAGHGWRAGLCLALGFACKPQALYYVPLLILIQLGIRRRPIAVLQFALPIILCALTLTLWDSARGEPTGLWQLAAVNNDPGRLIRSDEILTRLRIWLTYVGAFAGPGWLSALLALGALAVRVRRRDSSATADLLLITYLVGYVLLHWLVAFNTYDRYLLLILPAALLVMARGLADIQPIVGFRAASLVIIASVMTMLMLPSAWAASEGRATVGADRGQHAGIDALADYLNTKPVATIIYDHWLGWELGYYLGSWSDKRRVYYPRPNALAADALLQTDPAPRYFPAPAHQPIMPWLRGLEAAGFAVTPVYRSPQFVVYALIHPQSVARGSAAGSSWPGRMVWWAGGSG